MKRIYIFLLGLTALSAVSCVEENFKASTSNELIITGGLNQETRTTFVEDGRVIETHWNINDAIGISTDDQYNLKYKAKESGKYTEFQLAGEEQLIDEDGKTVFAYYPYHSYNPDKIQKDSILITLGRGYDRKEHVPFLYGQAQINNGVLNFHFKHLFAYLRLKISTQDVREQYEKAKKMYADDDLKDISKGGLIVGTDADCNLIPSRSYFNFKTNKLSGYTCSDIIIDIDDLDMDGDSSTVYIPIIPQPAGTELMTTVYFKCNNHNGTCPSYEYRKKVSKDMVAGHVYNWNCIEEAVEQEEAKVRSLLEAIYHKTNGNNWIKNDYWLSEKPLNKWPGIVTKGFDGGTNGLTFKSLHLHNNGLSGPFLEEFAEIMDRAENRYNSTTGELTQEGVEIGSNYLYGRVPDVVKEQEHWKEWGWSMIKQWPHPEHSLDLTNSNLYVTDALIEDIVSGETQTLYEILSKNKVTQILQAGSKLSVTSVNNIFIDKRVNQHLDYQSKGMTTIVFCGDASEDVAVDFKKSIQEVYGNVDGIIWAKGDVHIPKGEGSSSYFFDARGELMHYAYYNPTCPNWGNNLVHDYCNQFLKSQLGDPADHSKFAADIYVSTDYSRDGEVIKLQEATEGQGINLIFLGEGYVDKDMGSTKKYENDMKKAMKSFFATEPYKSMKNRFNVYTVKAVSRNEAFTDNSVHAFDANDQICFEYARRIPDLGNGPLMVTVIYKYFTFNSIDSSFCTMYDDGSYVAYVLQGPGDQGVIAHESGGHGFGSLYDEYISQGKESVEYSTESRDGQDSNWINFGKGANVDWRNDPSTVKWSHFLQDSRYSGEVGIYEGACYVGKGIYRPSKTSIMRNAAAGYYNAPSREQIYKRIMKRSEGEGWVYDYEEFVKYDEINRNTTTRSCVEALNEAEDYNYIENHRPPKIVHGTWRDAIMN